MFTQSEICKIYDDCKDKRGYEGEEGKQRFIREVRGLIDPGQMQRDLTAMLTKRKIDNKIRGL